MPSAYLAAFRGAGLDVVACEEPRWGQEEAETLPWKDERPDLWELALAELPMVIVWDLVRAG